MSSKNPWGLLKGLTLRLENYNRENTTRGMWQWIRSMTNYRTDLDGTPAQDAIQLDILNKFYARFDQANRDIPLKAPCDPEETALQVAKTQVLKALRKGPPEDCRFWPWSTNSPEGLCRTVGGGVHIHLAKHVFHKELSLASLSLLHSLCWAHSSSPCTPPPVHATNNIAKFTDVTTVEGLILRIRTFFKV